METLEQLKLDELLADADVLKRYPAVYELVQIVSELERRISELEDRAGD